MSNVSKALRIGLGSVSEVAIEIANLPPNLEGTANLIRNCATHLEALIATDANNNSAVVLCCAVLNSKFRESGDMWRCKDNGELEKNYIGTGPARDAIADLLGV
jgi:hypothetical protein